MGLRAAVRRIVSEERVRSMVAATLFIGVARLVHGDARAAETGAGGRAETRAGVRISAAVERARAAASILAAERRRVHAAELRLPVRGIALVARELAVLPE